MTVSFVQLILSVTQNERVDSQDLPCSGIILITYHYTFTRIRIIIPYQRAILNCRSHAGVADFARLVGHSPARLSRGGVYLG